MKALGNTANYNSSEDTGMAKEFTAPYYLDVIGTSYCRSRAIACTKMSMRHLKLGELQKVI